VVVPARVQLVALKLPVELLVKPTPPEGVIGVPIDVSVTVAVQTSLTGVKGEEQLTLVLEERRPTRTVVLPLLSE
jgi:hypothetical protein